MAATMLDSNDYPRDATGRGNNRLRVLSLFAGIGGIDLGLERAGMRVVAHSELEPYACQVLEKHWPDVPNLGDITTIDWADCPEVDVIAGGFPCQDISLAGKGAGIKEGTRSGLWSYYADAVRELRPRYVLVENVAALLARGLDRVLGDLAALGYGAWWDCVPAAAVGAPHRRDRLFIVATRSDVAPFDTNTTPMQWAQVERSEPHGDPAGATAHANGQRGERTRSTQERRQPTDGRSGAVDPRRAPSDPRGDGRGEQPTRIGGAAQGVELERGNDAARLGRPDERGACGCDWEFIDADGFCSCCHAHTDDPRGFYAEQPFAGHYARCSAADADDAGRGKQWRTEPVRAEQPAPARGVEHEGDWDAERGPRTEGVCRRPLDQWRAEPGVGRVAPGVPRRVDRLRCLGNAVVPQVAQYLGELIVAHHAAQTLEEVA